MANGRRKDTGRETQRERIAIGQILTHTWREAKPYSATLASTDAQTQETMGSALLNFGNDRGKRLQLKVQRR